MSAVSALRLREICRRRNETIYSLFYRNWTWARLPFPSNIWICDCVPLVSSGLTSILKFKRFVCALRPHHASSTRGLCLLRYQSLCWSEWIRSHAERRQFDHAWRLPTMLVVRPAAATAQYLLQFIVLGLITQQCICVCRVAALSKLLDGSICVWRLIRPIVQGNLWYLLK